MPDDTLSDAITTNALGPSEVQGDSSRVAQHSLFNQVIVDKYLAAKRAQRAGGIGIVFARIVPSGAE